MSLRLQDSEKVQYEEWAEEKVKKDNLLSKYKFENVNANGYLVQLVYQRK